MVAGWPDEAEPSVGTGVVEVMTGMLYEKMSVPPTTGTDDSAPTA
jgi:hypothetical protein